MSKKLEIKPGDRVSISALGATRIGVVTSAINYATAGKDCWYIELHDEIYGAVYWRQDSDGGTVTKL